MSQKLKKSFILSILAVILFCFPAFAVKIDSENVDCVIALQKKAHALSPHLRMRLESLNELYKLMEIKADDFAEFFTDYKNARLLKILDTYREYLKSSKDFEESRRLLASDPDFKGADNDPKHPFYGDFHSIRFRNASLLGELRHLISDRPAKAPNTVLLQIKPAQNSEESIGFQERLLKAYLAYCKENSYTCVPLAEGALPNIGRAKFTTIRVSGLMANRIFRGESGFHKLSSDSSDDGAIVRVLSNIRFPRSSKEITILDSEIEVTTVRASGPGGQNVNKTESQVQILHLATGIRVYSKEERKQKDNRENAMELLREELFKHYTEVLKQNLTSDVENVSRLIDPNKPIRVYGTNVLDQRTGATVSHSEFRNGRINPLMQANETLFLEHQIDRLAHQYLSEVTVDENDPILETGNE